VRSYLFRERRFHCLQSRAGSRWRAVRVSSRRVARVVTGDGRAGTDAPVAVSVSGVCMCGRERWVARSCEVVCVVGSRPKAVVVGKRPGPARCRAPYWQDAWPWRRRRSRVTTVRLRNRRSTGRWEVGK
jgi:hypothetical protein